jgi:sortase A
MHHPARAPGGKRRLDLRAASRRLGGLLMIIGALVLGFLAFQLWGTGIEHANAQRELRVQFEQSLRPEESSAGPKATSTTPRSPAVTTSRTTPPRMRSRTTVPRTTVPRTTVPRTTTTAPPTTAPPTTAPPQPVFAPGDPVARLEIPRIGVDEIVVSGVGVEELKNGPGHYPQTPLPGQPGNAAIAGHRTTYGAPFFNIDQLTPGDEIIATTFAGRFVYRVTGTVVVAPTDVAVLAGTTDPRLTLTSCHPLYSASSRIVVTAQLDPKHSTPVTAVAHAVPDKRPPRTTAPRSTSTTTTTTAPRRHASVATTTTSSTTTSTTTTTTTSVPADADARRMIPLADAFGGPARPPGPAGADPGPSAQAVPALGTGWFDDPGALVDVLLWAAVCVGIVLVIRLATRRVGHRVLLGALGVLPFAVALFFFYENVNRVLPAGV